MPAEIPHDELLFTLNDLIETCNDGRDGFLDAAHHATDSRLQHMCSEYAQQRAGFAADLQREVLRLGGDLDRKGTVLGALHRRWIQVRAAIVGLDDRAIIAECERGEDIALEHYREASGRKLPHTARELVVRQFEQVQQAHDRFRDLKQHGLE
jgi:uncharacterized protein (TIGR02284 family)